MSEPISLTTARARFEAARRLTSLPAGHRRRALHGHGFVATAHGYLTPREIPFAGAQSHVLAERLHACVDQIDYSDLNQFIDHPDDLALARWIRNHIGLDSLDYVGIQSTHDQGVQIAVRSGNRLEEFGSADLPEVSEPVNQTIRIWRRYHFKAAHQLPNVGPDHKCGRMHGHGFQVILHVDTDGVISYDDLDAAWSTLQVQLHQRCLNDIEGLSNPTSEMLSSWIWTRIRTSLPSISWVTVFETASCGAQFDGERYQIWKDFTIDSAIRMNAAPSGDPRSMIHGDTFLVRLHLSADLDTVKGWTVDFGDVKAAFKPVFQALDHRPLYENESLARGDAESIARWTFKTAKESIPQLSRVDVIDSEGAGAIVFNGVLGAALPA